MAERLSEDLQKAIEAAAKICTDAQGYRNEQMRLLMNERFAKIIESRLGPLLALGESNTDMLADMAEDEYTTKNAKEIRDEYGAALRKAIEP